MNKTRRNALVILSFIAVGLVALGWWFRSQLAPMPQGKAFYIRFSSDKPLRVVLERLAERKVVRNPGALYLYARLKRSTAPVAEGTYSFQPGMTAAQIFRAARTPVRQFVRLPENFWIKRNALRLEKNGVCTATDYIAWTQKPQEFQKDVKFPLPKSGSLEGYLYPDTYDLPPMLGGREVVKMQLKTFEKKVWKQLKKPNQLHRTLTIASMIQLEVAKDKERPIVASVIENRLRTGMRLQFCSTVLYAMQVWKTLTHADIVATRSPYNTYQNAGMPPGPICSPSLKSILAAENPAASTYLYFVADTKGNNMFATTLAEHNANINKRHRMLKGAQ
jgi:UPF0755 protein